MLLGFTLAGALLAPAAMAQGWDGNIAPYRAFPGNAQLDISGLAGGAVFGASGAGGSSHVSGAAKANLRLHRDYDSGLSLGLNATLLASDVLSRGRYDGDVIEKAFGELRTGLGWLQVGQTDGAAYTLAVSGPKVDDQASLDNPQTVFFRDPSTGRPLSDIFALRTQVGASSNYAKFTYLSPGLFGAQLALSFTPNQAKYGLPFLHAGPQVAGRQVTIWEGAIQYADDFGPVSLSAYAGGAWGRAEHKAPGQEGVSDLGAGLRAEYPINDEMSVAVGGAWRQSNAHAFVIERSFQANTTRALQASATLTYNDWTVGAEFGDGDAGRVGPAPHLGITGYQASLGYRFSDSIGVSTGWQRLNYARSAGRFYNGAPRIKLDAAFAHLNFKTSD